MELNRNKITKLVAFFLLQGLQLKLDNKRKILETPIFLDLFSERGVYLLLKFLHFVDNEKCQCRGTK
jgi:hypothetical protein